MNLIKEMMNASPETLDQIAQIQGYIVKGLDRLTTANPGLSPELVASALFALAVSRMQTLGLSSNEISECAKKLSIAMADFDKVSGQG